MKHKSKLFLTAVMLLTAAVMLAAASFAWMTISNNPVLQGIQITVGGGGTVLVAPDVTETGENGKVFHYPGEFSSALNFSAYSQYDYLNNTAGLVPVSTADGETWYIPTYQYNDASDHADAEISGFVSDNMLLYANLNADDEKAQKGSYIYLDFWVVAPREGYVLRVSTSDDSAGSYVIDLLDPEENDFDSYTLTRENQQAAACMRVGFLVNEDWIIDDDTMLCYTKSEAYNDSYTRLQGIYSDPGCSALYSLQTRFTIYEPNGDLHPTEVTDSMGDQVEDGEYVITEPLGLGAEPVDISDRLTVQLRNEWTSDGDDETLIAQIFNVFLLNKTREGETAQSLKESFYGEYLRYQLYPYLTKGRFLTSTKALYEAAYGPNRVDAEKITSLGQAGATEDVYLTELTGGVPQRIRMFVWLEGQDVDCINSAETGSFAVSIELSGSNAS